MEARLDISEDRTAPLQYVSLSHRWGNANVPKLTTHQLTSIVERGVPVHTLPKTFQDAFAVTKRLGYRYIWIDSLCIVQDSVEDWQKEASMMGEVYANAQCNISATGAKDSDEGLFIDRNAKLVRPCKVRLKDSSPWLGGEYYILDPLIWPSGVSEAPLNARGWVFEERVMAKRILHFGKDQLFFECHELDACETFPSGLPTSPSYRWRPLGAASNGHFKRQDPATDGASIRESNSMGRLSSDQSLNTYSLWSDLVETYSGLSLTKEEDKLIAFSAIAKKMRHLLKDEYLAGLWRRHLPYQLLWTKRKDVRSGTESLSYRAPSWSWASLKDKVTLYPITSKENEKIVIEILEAETFPVAEDDTGQLVGGYLRLEGFLRAAEWAFYKPQSDSEPWTMKDLAARLSFEGWDKPRDITVWEDEWDRINLVEFGKDAVFCLPIHLWWNEDGDICTEGLVLAKIEFQDDLFRRVGKFKIELSQAESHEIFYGVPPSAMLKCRTRATERCLLLDESPLLEAHEICII